MISFVEALDKIVKNTPVLLAEEVGVTESVGRVLAQDICSPINMPPMDKSAMDGYAVNYKDAIRNNLTLKCGGVIQAGSANQKSINEGQCVKIMTGAPIPKTADTVVMVENTKNVDTRVKILKPIKKGQNICFKGEDITVNQKLLAKGKIISIADIALIATTGKSFIKVIKKPTVAFLNTGDEIVPAGKKLPKNKIYNSNGPQLAALLSFDGISGKFLGIVKDKPEALTKTIKKGLNYDILLISGGVSMGDYDFIPQILQTLKIRKIFHKVKIKPGKPLLVGKHKKTLIFGVPGNPVSNFTTYMLFIRTAIYKMMGYKNFMPQFKEGIIKKTVKRNPGRLHFVPVTVEKKNHKKYLTPPTSHGSADIVSLSQADGFMMVDADKTLVKKNEKIKYIIWKKR
ncbi:MAG: molybdopterin molybdotransferase MoeA [Candidatus Omnitrophica bacterium]|nr:molybdopterin molybdotransferase MoeA [Candidatus Omnitrophota bacterium]